MGIMASVAAGAAVFFLLHVGLWRTCPSNEPRVTLLGSLLLIGIGVALVLNYTLGQGEGLELCAVLWVGISCGVFYVIFYSALARSVSLTLLWRLFHAGSHPIRLNDLVKEYAASERFEDRIRLMHGSGLLRLTRDLVELTEHGAKLARWARSLGRILGSRLEG